MPAVEITAHDVETAVRQGLAQLGLLRAEVRIEVLDEGSRGVLGIGTRPARVRLTPYDEIQAAQPAPTPDPGVSPAPAPPAPAPEARAGYAADEDSAAVEDTDQPTSVVPPGQEPEPVEGQPVGQPDLQLAVELTQGVLDRMGFATYCTARLIQAMDGQEAPAIWVDITGQDAARLLSHQCEPLEALQLVVQMMWAHRTKTSFRITLDADQYKAQRQKRLAHMAERLAERVVSSGRPITLEPMPPAERRLVHLALRDHPGVTTESRGEGSSRRLTIKPKK